MSYPEPYSVYPPAGGPVAAPAGSRAVARVLSGLCGLVLTPVALGLLAYGSYLHQRQIAASFAEHGDALGITLAVAGAVLLFGVAVLGAWSGTGPIAGGLVWCLVPGVITLVAPRSAFDLLDLLPRGQMTVGVAGWMSSGALLGTGFLLVGTGLAVRLARRRR
ncbi:MULTISPECIES: hypothetical protein [unclassified Amycolatopsis]|uniref:hypothetical protein n=1 Tax=unclassified Amycolatopsis TaxID=2618356 RepID=UPI00068DDDCE|nr:hypothetical protein [Amycolatopsis sp. Poz14]